MSYNLEAYRTKREKVLGVKSNTVSFGKISTFLAGGIMLIIAIVVIPQMANFLKNRNLEDVIYRLNNNTDWSSAPFQALDKIPGVVAITKDQNNHRLIITYNRTQTKPVLISGILKQQNMDVIQLNVISHNQRLTSLKTEAKFETL